MSKGFLGTSIIEPINLNDAEKLVLAKVMAEGNKLLKESYSLAKRKHKKRYALIHFRTALFKLMNGHSLKTPLKCEGITIPVKSLRAIAEVRKIEYKVLQSVSLLVVRQAKSAAKNSSIPFPDLYNDGIIAVLNAIYGYDRIDIKFSTYAMGSIFNKLNYSKLVDKPLSHWTEEQNKLRIVFMAEQKKAEQELVNNRPRGKIEFDEICDRLKFSDDERSILLSMETKVVTAADIAFSAENNLPLGDYTSIRKYCQTSDLITEMYSKEIMSKAFDVLDEWETAVLKCYLAWPQGTGWKTKVSNEFVSRNGTTYTRAAPEIAMKRIRRKLLAYFKEAA